MAEPATPMPIRDQIEAARRELRMRQSAYPRWVASSKMSQKKADHEIAAMTAILATLEAVERGERLI